MSESNGLLTRTAIDSVSAIDTRDIPVPEWGGVVRVRGMTGKEVDDWELRNYRAQEAKDIEAQMQLRPLVVVNGLIDSDGESLYAEKDIPELQKKSGAVLTRLYEEIMRLSGLLKSDSSDEGTAIDAEKKSLSKTTDSSSGTG